MMIVAVYNIIIHLQRVPSSDEHQDVKTKLTGLPRGVTLSLLLLLDFHFNGNRELKNKSKHCRSFKALQEHKFYCLNC